MLTPGSQSSIHERFRRDEIIEEKEDDNRSVKTDECAQSIDFRIGRIYLNILKSSMQRSHIYRGILMDSFHYSDNGRKWAVLVRNSIFHLTIQQ